MKTKRQIAAVTPATRPDRRSVPDVPKTLDLITDAVGEMLTRGTNDYCLDRLLVASISHIARRSYEDGIGTDNEATIHDAINTFTRRDFGRFKADVIAAWRRTRRKSPAAVAPKTITELIRANVREELEVLLDQFVGRGTPEELRFMSEVMRTYGSFSHGVPTGTSTELAIGQAFISEIEGAGDIYLRIPERLREKVEVYAEALIAVEDRAA